MLVLRKIYSSYNRVFNENLGKQPKFQLQNLNCEFENV